MSKVRNKRGAALQGAGFRGSGEGGSVKGGGDSRAAPPDMPFLLYLELEKVLARRGESHTLRTAVLITEVASTCSGLQIEVVGFNETAAPPSQNGNRKKLQDPQDKAKSCRNSSKC